VVLLFTATTAFAGSAHPVELAALALAFLGLSSTIPTLITAIFSGTIADRTDRLHLMRWTNAAALFATAAVVALLYFRPSAAVAVPGRPDFFFPEWVVLLYPLWAIETTAVTLFRPAFNASLPQVVGRPELGRANGLVYATALVLSVSASLLAGWLTNTSGAAVALAVPIVLFGFTMLLLAFAGTPLPPERTEPLSPFLTEAKEGYGYLWNRRPLLALTLAALAVNFFSAVAFVELGLYVVDWLGVSQAILVGAMMAGGSLGAAAGTLLINRFRFEERAGSVMTLLIVFQGASVGVLGLVHTIWIALPDMFLFGLFPGMFTTVLLATIQSTVPNRILGRVLAADEVGSFAMIPVGQWVGGLVTAVAGIPMAYFAAGGGTVAVGILMSLYGGLRRLGFNPSDPARGSGVSSPPSAPLDERDAGLSD